MGLASGCTSWADRSGAQRDWWLEKEAEEWLTRGQSMKPGKQMVGSESRVPQGEQSAGEEAGQTEESQQTWSHSLRGGQDARREGLHHCYILTSQLRRGLESDPWV